MTAQRKTWNKIWAAIYGWIGSFVYLYAMIGGIGLKTLHTEYLFDPERLILLAMMACMMDVLFGMFMYRLIWEDRK